MRESILCSAIHFNNGIAYAHSPINISSGFVICGRRHHDCFNTMRILDAINIVTATERTQGFLTNTNRFVDRQEGFKIARCAMQIKRMPEEWDSETILTSEDLY